MNGLKWVGKRFSPNGKFPDPAGYTEVRNQSHFPVSQNPAELGSSRPEVDRISAVNVNRFVTVALVLDDNQL